MAKSKLENNEDWTDDDYQCMCKNVLLSTDDARIWTAHVELTAGRRKAGVKKAAATRASKRIIDKGNYVFQNPVDLGMYVISISHSWDLILY